ncbi:hypothetical protein M2451_002599 [Dysgonomonas sp. PFB1-18]|uniref:hypothetical protein n=1 Tax=unclassified Dysgonomonas TaxID=2630389 RepID=UPI00247549C4|nr:MULTISPECIES: hypothetical protein [unclassified Dysgonomonas]MDH6308080.1 hypothetical protein [Dysgonomonas sp. PF1-14]MDH6339619.1 hypothetical protein [Dysgonomonas sp. PF1-16]MDH6381270.1 hypothetical protein [Dysgonomonas sp. PFB1-18]MDH6398482.1 hypothetical protein [Dysgonomonas sp. PF1-23]
MRIEEQICSIEQAKKLKELGLVQSSSFYYVNNWRNPRCQPINDGEHIVQGCEKHITKLKGRERGTEVEFVSAYTATELGVLLPNILPYRTVGYGIVLRQAFPDGKEQDYYMAEYVEVYSDLDYGATVYEGTGETEAQSRACLLIEMIKAGHIEVKAINEACCPEKEETPFF